MGEKQGHTPGPWVSDEAEGEWAVGDADGRIVAYLHQDDIDLLSEREANAHLIAAAPDLLAAFSSILPPTLCGESWDLPDHDAVPITITFGKLKAARAAISRATGEDSPANEGEGR